MAATPPEPKSSTSAALEAVIKAVVTGASALAFISLCGGAIIYVRLQKFDLPAAEAVASVPREVLLTTAATFLVPAALWALAAIALLFVVVFVYDMVVADENKTDRDAIIRPVVGASLLFVFILVATASRLGQLTGSGDKAAVIGTAFILSGLALVVWVQTDRFGWFGLGAFFAIGVVFGMAEYRSIARDTATVSPVAVLRKDREPAAGFLVAQSGRTLMLGRTHPAGAGDRLVVMPREEVTDISIGKPERRKEARIKALQLAEELCNQFTRDTIVKPEKAKPAPKKPNYAPETRLCSDREIKNLTALLVSEQASQK